MRILPPYFIARNIKKELAMDGDEPRELATLVVLLPIHHNYMSQSRFCFSSRFRDSNEWSFHFILFRVCASAVCLSLIVLRQEENFPEKAFLGISTVSAAINAHQALKEKTLLDHTRRLE